MLLIQNQVVQVHPWLSQSEFIDLLTISQMTPGPIAVNSATFVGMRIAGMKGAIVATAGCVLPSCILVTLLAKIYLKYRNLSLLQLLDNVSIQAVGIFIGSLILLRYLKINAIYVMLLSGIAEVVLQLLVKMK